MKKYNIYQAGGKTGAAYGRRNAPDPPEPDPTFWDHVQDVGEYGLNTLLTPFETITGVNFYDPEFESDFMQTTSDITSAVVGAGTDIVGNIAAPGLYSAGKAGASALGQGLGLQDATHGEHGTSRVGSKVAGTIEAVGGLASSAYGMGMVQQGGPVSKYQTIGNVSGSPTMGQSQGMSPAFMQNAPEQTMPFLQSMFGPQGMGGGQMFAQMGQQSNFAPQQGSFQNYMGNLGQNSLDPSDKMGIGPMAMTGNAINTGLNIANIWSGKTKTQSEMVNEAEQSLEAAQRNARIKGSYNPTQMNTNLLNPEFLASYKTGLKETNAPPPGLDPSLVERGGRIGEHMRKYQNRGNVELPKYQWEGLISGLGGMFSGGGGGGGGLMSMFGGGAGGGAGGGGLMSMLGGLGGGGGDKGGDKGGGSGGLLAPEGKFRRGIRDMIGSYFLGPLGPQVNKMIQSTGFKHPIQRGGNIKAQTGYNSYYGDPDIYGGGLNPQEQYFANLGQGLGQTFGGPAGKQTADLVTGLYKGISDINKPKILGPGGLRPYMESNFAGYSPNNAAVLSNLGTKHKDFQKFAYHLNRLSPENTDTLEANRAVTARSQMAQSGGPTEAVEIEVEGGETIKTIDGENNKFMGPSHDQGGVTVDANEGDFVYPKGTWAKRHVKRTKREADILAQLEAAGINTEDLA